MGIQTAAVLYPVNTTTVDSGGAIDIRLLDSAQAGADDDTQTATATHTQDNVDRTFDPATAGVTASADVNTLQKLGWALRLSEDMTPPDDTNCNAFLRTGNLVVNVTVTITQAGGTYTTGTYAPLWKASLWRYNPATDTATIIGFSANNTPSWNIAPVGGDLGTFKTIAITFNSAAQFPNGAEFAAGEILLLQLGVKTQTIPNPTVGTATWTYTLRVDHTNTNITFVAEQGIRQICTLALDATGIGTASQDTLTVGEFLEAIGVGTADESHITAALVTLDAIGVGTASDTHAVALSGSGEGLDAVGVGTADARLQIDFDDVPTGSGGNTYSRSRVVNR